MAKHEVGLEINQITAVGKVDIRIPVWSDDRYLGSLHVSNGSLDWVAARNTKYPRFSVAWEEFARYMEGRTARPITSKGRRAPSRRRN